MKQHHLQVLTSELKKASSVLRTQRWNAGSRHEIENQVSAWIKHKQVNKPKIKLCGRARNLANTGLSLFELFVASESRSLFHSSEFLV
jgi:hypothetical protein